jgi:hypothetical protein
MQKQLLVVLFAAACGPTDLTLVDLASPPPLDLAATVFDPTKPPPTAHLTDWGGPRLAHPQVWTVVYDDDADLGPPLAGFTDWMLNSDYWKVLDQYGVGSGESKGVVTLHFKAPTTVDDPGFGLTVDRLAMDPQYAADRLSTIFVFVAPPTSTLTLGSAMSCSYFAGYHSSSPNGFAYAVMPQCRSVDGKYHFDDLTEAISHELAEATTDPLIGVGSFTWDDHQFTLGEVGDLCNSVYVGFPIPGAAPDGGDDADGGTYPQYWVQRLFSNRDADAGRDPCQPTSPPDRPFAGVALDPAVVVVAPGQSYQANLVAFDAQADDGFVAIGFLNVPMFAPLGPYQVNYAFLKPGESAPFPFTAPSQPGSYDGFIYSKSKHGRVYMPYTILVSKAP